ncbi:glycosyl transferase family 2 domain-containing protein [Ditylenchus destructor]|uniref:Polypeptide N-acetylgalactosaminyltransferase n=1 Tax=Ditylenchus destructor TaxID=166010 RepID=A0AAD4NHR7_9BILA|nr:glycosyl transferase family 2 domain-containing protein [Ditylenchus destructor]
MNYVERLPPEEGRTWPSQMPEIHIPPDPSAKRDGPGEMGAGITLIGEEEKRGNEDMKKWFMNVVASDKISLDRSLPDKRHEDCKKAKYNHSKLPKASVVIIFTDEAWSPLLRTVHSVINRSPDDLLHEVLLVDDFSQRKELKEKLDRYIERFQGKVRIVRKTERQGLIRAKLAGAIEAKGEVVVFLDSHCEANHGWLEPMLQRISEKRTAIVCPSIDFISATNLAYSGGERINSVGGFWWSLHFRWDPIPQKILDSRKFETDPIPSPTMAGGLLAANRKYFLEVGGYDAGMDIWGGENLEISFRVWMCGGSIEFIPCSHVGHIFRSGHPYDMTGPGGNKDVHGTNSKRLAEVWMDDYKRLYYLHRRDLKNKDVGNLTERIELRRKLKCKNFKWYLDNVIPHKFIPDENVLGYGALRNPEKGLCLDTLQKDENSVIPLGVFACQGGGSSAQVFSLSKENHFRREITCANVEWKNKNDPATASVVLNACSKTSQTWKLGDDGLMRNVNTGLCMDANGAKNGDNVPMNACDSSKATQKWEFIYGSES